MKNLYYNHIISILLSHHEGVKVVNIARTIYNENHSLFEDRDFYKKLHSSISVFLWTQSKKRKSPFMRVKDKWGVYALKRHFALQLELVFDNWEYDSVETTPINKTTAKHQQPLLFSDEEMGVVSK